MKKQAAAKGKTETKSATTKTTQLKKEAEKIGEDRKVKQIAKQLREKGFTVDQVVELTGISKEEAEKMRVPKK